MDYDRLSGMEATVAFGMGLMDALTIAKGACEEFPEDEMDFRLALSIIKHLTEDESLGYDMETIETCSEMIDNMLDNGVFETYDEGVVFACNMIIDGINQSEGDAALLKVYLDMHTPEIKSAL